MAVLKLVPSTQLIVQFLGHDKPQCSTTNDVLLQQSWRGFVHYLLELLSDCNTETCSALQRGLTSNGKETQTQSIDLCSADREHGRARQPVAIMFPLTSQKSLLRFHCGYPPDAFPQLRHSHVICIVINVRPQMVGVSASRRPWSFPAHTR